MLGAPLRALRDINEAKAASPAQRVATVVTPTPARSPISLTLDLQEPCWRQSEATM